MPEKETETPEEEIEAAEEAETLLDSTKCEGAQHSVLLQVALKSVVPGFSFGAASLNYQSAYKPAGYSD